MNHKAEIEVALVIVLYNPDAEDLMHARSMAQTNRGVIVDNSPQRSFEGDRVGRMRYCFMGRNCGIAEAQNVALRMLLAVDFLPKIEAYARGCVGEGSEFAPRFTHFVFLDQDSRTEADFPEKMAQEFELAQEYLLQVRAESPERLAVLGPTIVNKLTGESYSSAFHTDAEGAPHYIPSREVISSGACIGREALESAGLNDESLFIDMVDHEWCWRARSQGWAIGTTPQLTLPHLVGRRPLKIFSHTVLRAAPVRHYYLWRNYLLLRRRDYVPRQWKWAMGIKRLLAVVLVPFTQTDGLCALPYMWRGIKDGLRGRGGRM